MSYVPATVNLTSDDRILQGSTYYREFALTNNNTPVDLSSWVGAGKGVRCQMRPAVSSATVVATPTMTIVSPATDGKIGFRLGSDVTTALTTTEGVYDVELFDNNTSPPTVERVVGGSWSLDLEVTR